MQNKERVVKRTCIIVVAIYAILMFALCFTTTNSHLKNNKTVANADGGISVDTKVYTYTYETDIPVWFSSTGTPTNLFKPIGNLTLTVELGNGYLKISKIKYPSNYNITTNTITYTDKTLVYNGDTSFNTLILPFKKVNATTVTYYALKFDAMYTNAIANNYLTSYHFGAPLPAYRDGDIHLATALDVLYGYTFKLDNVNSCVLSVSTSGQANVLVVPSEIDYTYTYLSSFNDNEINMAYRSGYDNGQKAMLQQSESIIAERANELNNKFVREWLETHDDEASISFIEMLGAVADTPVNAFKAFFDFNILGLDMKSFICSILTICLIITVVKLLT